jgi:hypothetical protein
VRVLVKILYLQITYHFVRSTPKHIAWNEELIKALKGFAEDGTQTKDWIQIVQNMTMYFSEFKYNFTRENVRRAYKIHIQDN